MKSLKNAKSAWSILRLSTIGLIGAIALKVWAHKKKEASPLEKAAESIGRVTHETKEQIDSIVQEVRTHLSGKETAGQSNLSEMAEDFKGKLDAMADQMKNRIRAVHRKGHSVKEAGIGNVIVKK